MIAFLHQLEGHIGMLRFEVRVTQSMEPNRSTRRLVHRLTRLDVLAIDEMGQTLSQVVSQALWALFRRGGRG